VAVFIAQVANYFGLGSTTTQYPDGSWALDTLCCKLGRYRVRLVQSKLASEAAQWKGKQVHTSQLEIVGVRSYSEGASVARDVCALLSLASMSQVVAYSFSCLGETHRFSVRGVSMCYRPVLDIVNGEGVVLFLEQVWCNYRNIKRQRKLYAVIDMLTFADAPSRPLELKLAQIFIILENLKGTYARSHKIPFAGGSFRKVSTPTKKSINREPKLTFEDLLTSMLGDVGMKHGLKRIIALRNEIIHFGLTRKKFLTMNAYYNKAQDIVREYLLRLLGYDGRYFVYSRACRAMKSLAP
jgi:hypothetical protein